MEVGLHANIVDHKTDKIGSLLREIFKVLSERLNGNYGGTIQHLWIDFELVERHPKSDGKPSFPFRFAKRVSGRSSLGLPSSPDYFNVGHLSVRPDFPYLLSISKNEIVPYCLKLIYTELELLKTKEKRLGGFNPELFRNTFYEECKKLGYNLNTNGREYCT
jgi:hypothetical protein